MEICLIVSYSTSILMTTEMTTSSSEIYSDNSNTAIIVVFVLFSSFSIMINLFTVISIARHCSISVCTLLACCLPAVELLNAFACGATTLYSYLDTSRSFENSSVLCNFCAWMYVAFRIMATLIVTFLVFDRFLLSLRPLLYGKQWSSFRTRWIVPLSVFIVGALLASLPFVKSSYAISPDGGRFNCMFNYTGSFAIFYIAFHFVQLIGGFVVIPWVISREEGVDARLSVLVVGEMVVCRKGDDIIKIRESLKISRLVLAVVVLYHGCSVFFPVSNRLFTFSFSVYIYPIKFEHGKSFLYHKYNISVCKHLCLKVYCNNRKISVA